MKYLPVILASFRRNRTRSALTALSIAVAFFLFGLLEGIDGAFHGSNAQSGIDRLYVISRISLYTKLPVSLLPRIQKVSGVEFASYTSVFDSYYQDPKNTVPVQAMEPASYFRLYPEFKVPADQLAAMQKNRTGAIVGSEIARKYGWKIGDRVPLQAPNVSRHDGQTTWYVDVVGFFDSESSRGDTFIVYINYDYFDEMRSEDNGMVSVFMVRVADPAQAAATAKAIDEQFANSSHETRTQSEKELAQFVIKQLGDIRLIVNALIGAVFFTLMFVTGNTMMQSIQERLPEFGTLKVLGFSSGLVSGLLMMEILILCVASAAVGLGAATAFGFTFSENFPKLAQLIGDIRVAPHTMLWALVFAVLLAIISALPPLVRVNRLKVVDTLANR